MSSKNYSRAQAMVLSDKYNLTKTQFNEDLAKLVNRYFETGSITSETFGGTELQVVITLSIKKVKPTRHIPA